MGGQTRGRGWAGQMREDRQDEEDGHIVGGFRDRVIIFMNKSWT